MVAEREKWDLKIGGIGLGYNLGEGRLEGSWRLEWLQLAAGRTWVVAGSWIQFERRFAQGGTRSGSTLGPIQSRCWSEDYGSGLSD